MTTDINPVVLDQIVRQQEEITRLREEVERLKSSKYQQGITDANEKVELANKLAAKSDSSSLSFK